MDLFQSPLLPSEISVGAFGSLPPSRAEKLPNIRQTWRCNKAPFWLVSTGSTIPGYAM